MLVTQPPIDNKYDLVVIGTGFGSAFYLKRYQELNPTARILVLERGEHYTREWQLSVGLQRFIRYAVRSKILEHEYCSGRRHIVLVGPDPTYGAKRFQNALRLWCRRGLAFELF